MIRGLSSQRVKHVKWGLQQGVLWERKFADKLQQPQPPSDVEDLLVESQQLHESCSHVCFRSLVNVIHSHV